MTVSVVMPVYNGVDHVAESVASVGRQGGVDYELLIHDDGSTDGTAAVLQALAATDPRIDVSSGLNRGPAASRNLLVARARGEYVAFLDHDDLWPAGRLARQVSVLEATPDAPAVLGETLMFEALDADGRPLCRRGSRRVLTGLLQAALFRREAVVAAGSFDTEFSVGDDFDFLLRVIDTSGPLAVEPEIAVWYRIHPGQRTADRELTGAATARALARSLHRRRAGVGVGIGIGEGPRTIDWRAKR